MWFQHTCFVAFPSSCAPTCLVHGLSGTRRTSHCVASAKSDKACILHNVACTAMEAVWVPWPLQSLGDKYSSTRQQGSHQHTIVLQLSFGYNYGLQIAVPFGKCLYALMVSDHTLCRWSFVIKTPVSFKAFTAKCIDILLNWINHSNNYCWKARNFKWIFELKWGVIHC